MKYLLLLILISCLPLAQPGTQATTKPTVDTTITQPVSPTSAPISSEPKQLQEQPKTNVTIVAPEPEKDCSTLCSDKCKQTAQNSCTQTERSKCKASCVNEVIEASACTQACTYITQQPQYCKQKMAEFCTNRCVEICK
ncbi:hypothetical protein HY489_04335 [Candidatus Woesearchaeota archaeon]|nr:hypothetical protein [Candidatus Woesearchaeota archaeon]